jgi:uncharacterized repeat protein (TIGR03943 family)
MNVSFKRLFPAVIPWLDVCALMGWGMLFLKYRVTGQLSLLIHPNYIILTQTAGFVLLCVGSLRALRLIRNKTNTPEIPHVTLLPPGFGMGLMTGVAIAGLLITPTILNSETALQRGVSDTLPSTQTNVESFYNPTPPEDRSLVDWVRTLNAYPEPDVYTGQPANVSGFVVHPPELPEDFILLARFVITCCAVDAYPVGLPVRVRDRADYPTDEWLLVTGEMATETFGPRRQLIIEPSEIETIPIPSDPYAFNE